MDGPHKKSPTIRSELARANTEEDQHVPRERVERETEGCDQCVLVEGHKPRLTAVVIPRKYCQREAADQVILSPDPVQVGHDQATVDTLTVEY